MSRLSLLMGMFLAITVTGTVFLLAVLSKVPFATIISRSTIVFLLFGTLGVILGSILEIYLLPEVVEKNISDLKEQMKFNESDKVLADLGDLLEKGTDIPLPSKTAFKDVRIPEGKTTANEFGDLLD